MNGVVVGLTWINPDPASGNISARVLRRLNAIPSGPSDPAATLVYSGPASSSADAVANLLPSTSIQARTYFYAVYGCASETQCNPAPSTASVSIDLTQALGAGGYVLHWRHASADVCQDNIALGKANETSSPNWWKSCNADCATATARQLNATGVAESIAIGDALRSRAVPFGRVLSSEFCRNFTTAELMNLGPPIEQIPEITYFVYDEANRCANSQLLAAQPPAPGTNTALIGHAGFPSPCPILGELAWAEAAIFKPDGAGGAELIARVTASQWATLPNLPTPTATVTLTATASATATVTPMATATPSATSTPQDSPSNLVAVVDGSAVRLTWLNADPASGYTQARVLRRLNAPPQGADDPEGTLVFSGTGATASEALDMLLPDTATVARTYHYTVYACSPAGTCNPHGSETSLTPTLLQTLRAGSYVLHWRHAMATTCSDHTELGSAATTSHPGWWKSCDANCATATARQLNAAGILQATAIGDAVRGHGIPIGRILSSEFCRNVATAELMSFGVAIEQRSDVTFLVYDEASRCDASDALLSEAPAAGTNTAIIGHGFASGNCAVLDSLAFGEAAIFKPDHSGGKLFVARLRDSDWAGLN